MFYLYGGDQMLFMMCVIPVMVGFSRVYYQCHYLGDVTFGALIGLSMAYLGAFFFKDFTMLF